MAIEAYERTPEYDTSVRAFHYLPDRSVNEIKPEMSPLEQTAMGLALGLAKEAYDDGNPPIGSVLIVNHGSHIYGAKTHDKTSGKINGHAEIVAYEDAFSKGVVGGDLSHATLVTTAVMCSSCTPIYAEGKIGKIISAAPRRYVWQLTGIMRPRTINMHELLVDGDTDTISVINYGLNQSLGLFALYGRLKNHRIPKDVDEYLLPFIEQAYSQQ